MRKVQMQTQEEELDLLEVKNEELRQKLKKKTEHLEALWKEKEEINEKIEDVTELSLNSNFALQTEVNDQELEKMEKLLETMAEKRAVRGRLEEEVAQLKEQKLKMLEKLSSYQDFFEKAVKMTRFEDVQGLMKHLENLFYIRAKYEIQSIKLGEIDKKRNELLSLEDKHRIAMVDKNFLKSQLQTELENYQSEACTWQQKWDKIQATAAKKTEEVGEIKQAVLGIYKMTGGTVGEHGVNVNDTKTQLDKIVSFIKEYENIPEQFQLSLKKEKKTSKSKSKSKSKT